MSETLCVHLIEDYGVCSKPRAHLVHQANGISEREHQFEAPEETQYDSAVLSKRNLKKVAKASGTSVEDLEIIRQRGILLGKKMTVRWEKKADD